MRRGRLVASGLLLLLASSLPGAVAPGASTEACGQRPLLSSSFSASRVLGGHDAQVGAWPWSVSLQIHQAGGKFVHTCGGVLVTENSVLTAGHCLKGRKDPYYWRAVLGAHNLWKLGEHTAKRNIRHITVHPEFQTETFENDIALFKLHSAVRYSNYIQPICLPPAHLYQYIDNETECFISGWGRTAEKGKTSPVLKEAQVEIIPSSVCNSSDAYGGLVDNNMICAGSRSGGTDTCQGDSGGPLACYHSSTNTYYLIGIASFGVGCGRSRFPGIYVRLSQYRGWITSQLRLSNAAATPVSVTLTLLLTVTGVVLA